MMSFPDLKGASLTLSYVLCRKNENRRRWVLLYKDFRSQESKLIKSQD